MVFKILLCTLAILLQIQVTLFSNPDYLGIRLNAADLILPFAGLSIVVSLLLRKTIWPIWTSPYIWGWFCALVAVMSLALYTGYQNTGSLSSWALINKYIGFYVLLAYMALGAWVATNSKDISGHIRAFVQTFCGFYVVTLAASLTAFFASKLFAIDLWIEDFAWDGFMANRNAFAVLWVLVALFLIYDLFLKQKNKKEKLEIPAWIHSTFWVIAPSFMIFNGSRTAWLLGGILLVITMAKSFKISLRHIIPYLAFGCIITFVILQIWGSASAHGFYQLESLKADKPLHVSDAARLIALEDGLELYAQSNPIIGAGLGAYKDFQIEKRNEFLNIIDFTGLWLLVETGLIGVIVFGGFFIACGWQLYKNIGADTAGSDLLTWAIFFFLLTFIIMSSLHELTYTRFIWFMMGLALARPLLAKSN